MVGGLSNNSIMTTRDTTVVNSGNQTQPSAVKGPAVSANVELLNVVEGEAFAGKIVGITGEDVSIMLDSGKMLLDKMKEAMTFNVGDMLTFSVKEKEGNTVYIKPYAQDTAAMMDDTINKILDANNLTPTKKNYEIAEGLLRNNLPVDKASMQSMIKQAYLNPEASVDEIIALNKLNIPVNETNLNQYRDYVNNTHQLTNNIKDLGNELMLVHNQMLADIGENPDGDMATKLLNANSNILQTISDPSDTADISNVVKLMQQIADGENIPPANIEQAIDDFSLKQGIPKQDMEQLVTNLKNIGFDEAALEQLIKDSDTPLKLLNNINKLVTDGGAVLNDANLVKELLTGKEYGNILQEAFMKKMTISPKEMDNPEEINDIYESIYDKATKLANTFKGNTGGGNELYQQAKSVTERVDFIQQLNNMYAYAQIPLKMTDNNLNSELFVYMNKKGLKEKKDEVSALLHLDMEHLGATDVHVSLRGDMIHTKFYVEDEESAKIIDEHMSMLEKAINNSGFSLTNEVITRDITVNVGSTNKVIDELLGTDLEQSVKRYSFDVRM